MRGTTLIITKVSHDQTSYTVPCCHPLCQCCWGRVHSGLRTIHAGAGEFRRGADRDTPSCDREDAARTIGRWEDCLLEGRAEDHPATRDGMAASRGGNAGERERTRPGDYRRPAESERDECSPTHRAAPAIRERARRQRCPPSRRVQTALRQPIAPAATAGKPVGYAPSRVAPSRLR